MRRKTSSEVVERGDSNSCPGQVHRSAPLLHKEGVGGGRTIGTRRASVRRKLLVWYDKHKRDLPWRQRRSDPYAQWVAEIMLQQTRVETVIRYYDRFLSQFPNVKTLARADHQDVLKLWEGLGYYRRILNLHRAAQQVVESGGAIPTTSASLRELPGIGAYTAAAIASIAFDEPAAAVDANVARVIGRLLGLKEAASASARSRIQDEADVLLSRRRPGDFNQAWMDLGSSVCLPRETKCETCPLQCHCVTAGSSNRNISLTAPKPAPSKQAFTVGVLLHKNRMLVRRRPEGGLWSGLWEFPSSKVPKSLRLADGLPTLAAPYDVAPAGKPRAIGVIQHRLTHRLMTFHVFESDVELMPCGDVDPARWVTQSEFRQLPVSTAHRRIHELWIASRGCRSKRTSKASRLVLPTCAP